MKLTTIAILSASFFAVGCVQKNVEESSVKVTSTCDNNGHGNNLITPEQMDYYYLCHDETLIFTASKIYDPSNPGERTKLTSELTSHVEMNCSYLIPSVAQEIVDNGLAYYQELSDIEKNATNGNKTCEETETTPIEDVIIEEGTVEDGTVEDGTVESTTETYFAD